MRFASAHRAMDIRQQRRGPVGFAVDGADALTNFHG
jgi:hypothetical protein